MRKMLLLGIGIALALAVAPSFAQTPNIDINTPEIRSMQASMQARFDKALRPHFDSGALGFTNNGLVATRDLGKLSLKERAAVQAAVSEDNRERQQVYKQIALANKHPEWEDQIRAVFSRQWIESARRGWHYQDASGAWKVK